MIKTMKLTSVYYYQLNDMPCLDFTSLGMHSMCVYPCKYYDILSHELNTVLKVSLFLCRMVLNSGCTLEFPREALKK